MTLREFLDTKDYTTEVVVYHNHQPCLWWEDDDGKYNAKVKQFGIIDEVTLWVEI